MTSSDFFAKHAAEAKSKETRTKQARFGMRNSCTGSEGQQQLWPSSLVEISRYFHLGTGGPAFDPADATTKVGAPLFALFAKGGYYDVCSICFGVSALYHWTVEQRFS